MIAMLNILSLFFACSPTVRADTLNLTTPTTCVRPQTAAIVMDPPFGPHPSAAGGDPAPRPAMACLALCHVLFWACRFSPFDFVRSSSSWASPVAARRCSLLLFQGASTILLCCCVWDGLRSRALRFGLLCLAGLQLLDLVGFLLRTTRSMHRACSRVKARSWRDGGLFLLSAPFWAAWACVRAALLPVGALKLALGAPRPPRRVPRSSPGPAEARPAEATRSGRVLMGGDPAVAPAPPVAPPGAPSCRRAPGAATAARPRIGPIGAGALPVVAVAALLLLAMIAVAALAPPPARGGAPPGPTGPGRDDENFASLRLGVDLERLGLGAGAAAAGAVRAALGWAAAAPPAALSWGSHGGAIAMASIASAARSHDTACCWLLYACVNVAALRPIRRACASAGRGLLRACGGVGSTLLRRRWRIAFAAVCTVGGLLSMACAPHVAAAITMRSPPWPAPHQVIWAWSEAVARGLDHCRFLRELR